MTELKKTRLVEAMAALPALEGPVWWQQLRQEAITEGAAKGIPTRRDEEWKYTNMLGLEKKDWDFGQRGQTPLTAADIAAVIHPDQVCLVFENGRLRPDLSVGDLPAGVSIKSLATALKEDSGLLQQRLSAAADLNPNVFVDLSRIHLSGGVVIEVAAKTKVSPELHFIDVQSVDNIACNQRNIMLVGELAEVTVLQSSLTLDGIKPGFRNLVQQFSVGAGSQLRHYRQQQEQPGSYLVDQTWYELQRDARLDQFTFTAGAGTVRNNLDIKISGSNAEAHFNGLYLAGKGLHVDNHSSVEHAVPHSRSDQVYKGILVEDGRAVFNGKVLIREGAVGTDAGQLNKNLLLSNDAEIDTKPELQIDADDVKCAHGAAIGQLNQDELFYLQTRGIPKAAAEAILARGFLDELLEPLASSAFRASCGQSVDMFLQQQDGSR